MNIKERIKKELEIQKSIEGEKCQEEILLKFLEAIKTKMQWELFVNCEFHRYGKNSYESHRFYYPKEELINIVKAFS
ncbi:hypothetical protein [Clostridium saccharoperbutylacetonicum]|uniref:hypothetical protein n=1 Tax=Clostridium saccharoperbutylacetonicum TaxID=36745 RepID=UPI0039ECE1D6